MVSKGRNQVPSVDRLVLQVLERVERDDAFARPVLDATLARSTHLDARDRKALTRRVRGVLQWWIELDGLLEAFLPRGLERTDARIRWVLRIGAFGLLHEDPAAPFAAVDRAVDLAREVKRDALCGLVNAVLRRLAERAARGTLPWPDPQQDPVGHLAARSALPRWLAERWVARFGLAEAGALAQSLNTPAPLSLRVQAPGTRAEILAALQEQGVEARPAPRAPDSLQLGSVERLGELDLLRTRRVFVQDEAATLVGHLVAPEPGWRVLDACAAPGGKSAHLLSLMGGVGEVTARDAEPSRLSLLRKLAQELPLRVERGDLLAPPAASELGSFDAVLVDAPCSNLGTLRRHPEAKRRLSPEVIERAAATQARMLPGAAALVRPGGVLVYSVCSISREEGWPVVDGFLASAAGAEFEVEPPPQPELFAGLMDERHAMLSLPHRDGMDGFFALRLRRRPA